MSEVLEPGYIAKLFDEPIYLIGHVTETETIEKSVSVVPDKNTEVKTESVLKPLPTLSAKTNTKLLVIVDQKSLTEAEHIFISKLIAAVSLTTKDVVILTAGDPIIDSYSNKYEYQYLLQFGATSIPVQKEKYKIYKEKNHSVLVVDELEKVINVLEIKKLLWSSLQQMFQIKK